MSPSNLPMIIPSKRAWNHGRIIGQKRPVFQSMSGPSAFGWNLQARSEISHYSILLSTASYVDVTWSADILINQFLLTMPNRFLLTIPLPDFLRTDHRADGSTCRLCVLHLGMCFERRDIFIDLINEKNRWVWNGSTNIKSPAARLLCDRRLRQGFHENGEILCS